MVLLGFDVIYPYAATNYVWNSGAEDAANANHGSYGAGVTTTRAKIGQALTGGGTGDARHGNWAYHFRAASSSGNSGRYFRMSTAPSSALYVSFWVKLVTGVLPTLNVGFGTTSSAITQGATCTADTADGNGWVKYQATVTLLNAAYLFIYLPVSPTQTCDILIDDIQVEESRYTTYLDGDMGPGFRWLATRFNSSATRVAYYAGAPLLGHGEVQSLHDDATVRLIEPTSGLGVMPLQPLEVEMASGSGSHVQGIRKRSRVVTLSFAIVPTDSNIAAIRRTLLDKLQFGRPVVLQCSLNAANGSIVRQLKGHFIGDMQYPDNQVAGRAQKEVTVRFLASEPDWREVSQTTVALTMASSLSTSYVTARGANAAWTALAGLPGGTRRLFVGRDKTLYAATVNIGGSYVKVSKWTGSAWSEIIELRHNSSPSFVNDIAETLDGVYLYITGFFNYVGAATALGTAHIIRVRKSDLSYASVNGGLNANGECIAMDRSGTYAWVGGAFTAVGPGGATTAGYIARLTLSDHTWTALGASPNSTVRRILVLPDDNLAVFGDFTSAGVLTPPGENGVNTPTATAVSVTGGQNRGAGRRYSVVACTDEGRTTVGMTYTAGHVGDGLYGDPVDVYGAVTNYPTTNAVRIAWTAVTGATSIEIYATDSAGSTPSNNTPQKLMAVLAGNATSYDDLSYPFVPSTDTYDRRRATFWPIFSEGYRNTTGAQTASCGIYRTATRVWRSMGIQSNVVSGFTGGLVGGYVFDAALGLDGVSIVAVGSFTTADGHAVGGVAWWNGAGWFPMGAGVAGTAYAVLFAADGSVHVGGDFTTAGGRTSAARYARYIGDHTAGVWHPTDFPLPSGTVYALVERFADELVVGHTYTGSVTVAGITSVTNAGSSTFYPNLSFEGPGTPVLFFVWEDGTALPFNYPVLAAGEVLVIDLAERAKTITSNIRPHQPAPLLAAHDLTVMGIPPGVVNIGCLFTGTDSNSGAFLRGERSYLSLD